jgi:D-alanyl-lipoteichoic acid acyltransferase DltB (MBOAT superfamily)
LAASYVFYGFWSIEFCSLLVISTVVDFTCGRALARTENERKLLITASVVTNLGILGVFKYYDFFVSSTVELLAVFGLDVSPRLLQVVLPVGISFYTFQTMTYSIDIYRRQLQPIHDIFDFALFVSFFPQLVAGPIERASRLLPQLVRERALDSKMTREGLWLILVGLFKKAVVADHLAIIADNVFNAPGE